MSGEMHEAARLTGDTAFATAIKNRAIELLQARGADAVVQAERVFPSSAIRPLLWDGRWARTAEEAAEWAEGSELAAGWT